MSEQPWGGNLPSEVKNAIDDVFGASEARKRIAYTLMFYNHKPNVAEMNQIAASANRSVRTVQDVVRILGENSMFTTEFGSVPLYKHISTLGASKTLEGLGFAGRDEKTGGATPDTGEQPGTPIIEDGGEAPDEGVDAEVERLKARAADPAAMEEARVLREGLAKMSQRQDKLEATLDASLKEILTRMRSQEPATPLHVEPVVKTNPLTVDPPDEEEVETEPVRREEPKEDEEAGPFAGMSKQQIIDMAINNPDDIYRLRSQGVPPTSETIQAMAHTTSWKALELTTYTQAAYERSCRDGYEGSLSDFINHAVFKYFEDRGWRLDWVGTRPIPDQYQFPVPTQYPVRQTRRPQS